MISYQVNWIKPKKASNYDMHGPVTGIPKVL